MRSLLSGLLGALNSDEQEAVSGDLLEANDSLGASVLQVFSLIIRRQTVHWTEWQPWLILTTLAFPLAVVLSQTARDFAGWSAIYSWLLINNTDVSLLRSAGFWSGVQENSWAIGKFAFVLFCCSWACGRLIAQLSRNVRLSMALAFVVMSLFVNIIGLPFHARALLLQTNDRYFPNGAVFANVFYRKWFPLLIYGMTALLPLILGLVHEEQVGRHSKALRILFYCSTALVVVGLVEQRWLLMEMWSWQIIPARLLDLPNLLPVASVGPACLLLLEVAKRYSRSFSNASENRSGPKPRLL